MSTKPPERDPTTSELFQADDNDNDRSRSSCVQQGLIKLPIAESVRQRAFASIDTQGTTYVRSFYIQLHEITEPLPSGGSPVCGQTLWQIQRIRPNPSQPSIYSSRML